MMTFLGLVPYLEVQIKNERRSVADVSVKADVSVRWMFEPHGHGGSPQRTPLSMGGLRSKARRWLPQLRTSRVNAG